MAQLNAAGVHGWLADLTLVGGAIFDIVLGLLLLVRRFTRPVSDRDAAGDAGLCAAGTVLAPQLWADPLGPLTKIVPMMVAMLLTLAILDER